MEGILMNINFEEYFKKYNEKVLAGRKEGKEYRNELNLDYYDQSNDTIEIKIPEYFFSINSSFFLGCFGKSVRNLGEKRFREKYIFLCDFALKKGIEDGISRALNESIVE